MDEGIQIGVSTCLLGENVRYDGGHKRDPYLVEVLAQFFELVPVCPEFECGLGVPRESMRLEGDPEAPRLVTHRTRTDLTDRMNAFCQQRVAALAKQELCGFIFKKDSPSSGLHRVRVYRNGQAVRAGRGLFAAAVVERFPLLPVEEEGRLNDPVLRENFIERVFAYRRLRDLVARRGGMAALVDFHTRHKLQLMAHHPVRYRELGRLVATGKQLGQAALLEQYQQLFMTTLATAATPKKNSDVLMHIMGFFKQQLSADQKAELLELIDRYRRQLVPLVVPLTLINHYLRAHRPSYLEQQTYLDPHPHELMLRNHV